jgi:Icc-related predicted phosphoesterase
MRIHFFSDLHTEMGPVDLPHVDADVVVAAGDIGVGLGGLQWLLARPAHVPILYVPGNHEAYGQDVPRLYDALRGGAAGTHVTVLEGEATVVGGVRFLGCTLWTDFLLGGAASAELHAFEAGRRMRDFQRIRHSAGLRRFTPRDSTTVHQAQRTFLQRTLAEAHTGPTVVITHHAPSASSLDPAFRTHVLGPAYASSLDELVATSGAALWIHGHTHTTVDRMLGGCRLVANQGGYPDHRVVGFDPGRTVDV